MIEFKIVYQDEDGNDLWTRKMFFPNKQEADEHAYSVVAESSSDVAQYEILELG
jgi:hypothetical protein